MDSKELYDKAHKLHYSDANYDEALKLYQEVVSKYPDSEEARYAKTQVGNINQMSTAQKEIYTSHKTFSDNNTQFAESKSNGNTGYFSFNKMISPVIIKILYVLGAIALIVYGIMIISDNYFYYDNPGLLGILVIIVGNIIWRLICESTILAFKMYDKLKSIDNKLEK